MLRIRNLIITIKQQEILMKFAKSKTEFKLLSQRAEIILTAKNHKLMKDVRIKEEITRDVIKKWIERWKEAEIQLEICENETPRKLERLIRSILVDRPRSGKPSKFTAEQVVKIIAVSLESPEAFQVDSFRASRNVATGKILAPLLGATRTENDFLNHIKSVISDDEDEKYIFIMDQLNTHKSESLVRFIAEDCGISEDLLGEKGKYGILKSMETRKAFLSSKNHKIRILYTPKHCSWLNQIEIWFSSNFNRFTPSEIPLGCKIFHLEEFTPQGYLYLNL